MPNLELDSLNISVLKALEFFRHNKIPHLDLKKYPFPLVVGSGNAFNAGHALFSQQKAIFASESNFQTVLTRYKDLIKNKTISHGIIISASGEKDSVWEIKAAHKAGLKTVLLTCSADSSAAKIADEVQVFPKLTEPYTYNVSTYLGLFLAADNKKAEKIEKFILSLKLPKNFRKYPAYSFILPDDWAAIAPMLEIKKSELFGPNLSLRAFSFGESRHAKFVIRSKNELVISFGKNKYFGDPKHRLELIPPKDASKAWAMAVSYFLIGLIQDSKPDYYRQNIKKFCTDYGYKAYPGSKPFPVLVPGSKMDHKQK
ncbi:hypothetical protein JXE04_03925 [Patescibacteria group bacterium]|nr:hypothetical protein [Patescibacteria group bacterium]